MDERSVEINEEVIHFGTSRELMGTNVEEEVTLGGLEGLSGLLFSSISP